VDGSAKLKIKKRPSTKEKVHLAPINREYPVKLQPVKTTAQHYCQTGTALRVINKEVSQKVY
jgi:hypothetical protein